MSNACVSTLGSIEAIRPVFMIVMGVFLMLIAWRLAKASGVWTARILVSGAFLLGFGYSIVLPLHEAGLIQHHQPSAPAWQVVKLVAMNVGWLLFGLGVAMHADIFHSTAPRSRAVNRELSPHESVA